MKDEEQEKSKMINRKGTKLNKEKREPTNILTLTPQWRCFTLTFGSFRLSRSLNQGDLKNCANYTGITALSIPGKVINRIILNSIKELVSIQTGAARWISQSCTVLTKLQLCVS